MKKILILGTTQNHEVKRLTTAAEAYNLDVTVRLFSEISLHLNSELKSLLEEFESFDQIVARVEGRLANELRTILVTNSTTIRKRMLNGHSYASLPTLSKVQQYALFVANDIPIPETTYQATYTADVPFPIILKGISGSKGEAVHLVKDLTEFADLERNYGPGGFVTQKPLPTGEDYRVLVLGQRVLGNMKKIAATGEFVTNIHAGGHATLAEQERIPILEDLALRTAAVTQCEFGGVDIMFDSDGTPKVLEINRGAAYAGFEQVNPLDVSTEIITYMQQRS